MDFTDSHPSPPTVPHGHNSRNEGLAAEEPLALAGPSSVALARLIGGSQVNLATLTREGLWHEACARNSTGKSNSYSDPAIAEWIVQEFAGGPKQYQSAPAREAFGANFTGHFKEFLGPTYKKFKNDKRMKWNLQTVMETALKRCDATWEALQPIDLAKLPIPFKPRLLELLKRRRITISRLARELELSVPAVWKWVKGLNSPQRSSLPLVTKAEIILDVPPGTLSAAPGAQHLKFPTGLEVEEAGLGTTVHGESQLVEKKFFAARPHGRCLNLTAWPADLQIQWQQIQAAEKISFASADKEVADGNAPRTIEHRAYFVGCYFAYLLDSRGLDFVHLSFALLAHAGWIGEFIDFEREHVTKKIYNWRVDAVLRLVTRFLRKRDGWIWQQENYCFHAAFVRRLAPAYKLLKEQVGPADARYARLAWSQMVMIERENIVYLQDRIEVQRGESILQLKKTRLKPLDLMLADERPIQYIRQLIRCQRGKCEGAGNSDRRRAAWRTLMMLVFAANFVLRPYTLALLIIGKHVFIGKNSFRLRLTRAEAGCRESNGDWLFIDIKITAQARPELVADVLGWAAILRERYPVLDGRAFLEQRTRYAARPMGSYGYCKMMKAVTGQFLGDFCPGGFAFKAFRALLEKSLHRAGQREDALQVGHPFAPAMVQSVDHRDLQEAQELCFRELSKLLAPGFNPAPEGQAPSA